MKRFLGVLLAASLMVGCSSTESEPTADTTTDTTAEAEATTDTSDDDTVIIGLDDSFAPLGFMEDGELVGFDVDLAAATFEESGLDYEFKPIDWSTKELELNSGRIDCIWNGLTITPEREEAMLFTDPYLLNQQIIFVPEDSDIKTKADLAGHTVGVQSGSSSMDAVERDTETYESIGEISEYDTNVNAFMDLDIGRIDAVVCDEVVGKYYTENLDALNTPMVVLDENFGGEEYGVATRLEDTEFNELINESLNTVKTNGVGTEISEKWFGEDILEK